MPVTIIKSTGEKVPFDPEKILRTAMRAGAEKKVAEKVAREVAGRVREGITTREIFEMILGILDRESPPVAARYSLSRGLFRLGPAGFDFEKYVAELYRAYGYETELPDILEGVCVSHEVDVLATKDNRTAMIEAKFRNLPSIFIGLKDTMATWSRFLDLVDGSAAGKKTPRLDECWIVTNTKFSPDALKFAHCKNMVMTGWNHPEERSLASLIDAKALYPVTVLRGVDKRVHHAFADAQIMLLEQLVDADPAELARRIKIPEDRVRALVRDARAIISLG